MGEATQNKMKMGAAAPNFKNLPGVDNQLCSLSTFANKNVLVLFFSCNHCPYVQAYEDRLMALQKEFKDKGVQFVAINSNDDKNYPDDNFENMIRRAKDRKFNFVYLQDAKQDVAKAYGATHTPHLFVFNAKRTLSYTGRIDDNWQEPGKVTKTYLRDALTALTSGEEPALSQTFAIGCTIKWKT